MTDRVSAPAGVVVPPRGASHFHALGISARQTVWTGAVVSLAAVGLSLRYLAPPYPSDQANYLRAADVFPAATHNPQLVHQYVRVGITLPARLAIALLGYSQAAYYAVPLLALLLLAIGVYALGCLLFSRSVGVAAVVVVVMNPMVFADLSMPLPDILATALFTGAVAITVALRQERPGVCSSDRRRSMAFLTIGALLGWGYLTREFTVFLWPVILVLLRRSGWRSLLWLTAPLAVTLGGELALGAAVYGNPMVRWAAVSNHGETPVPAALAATYQGFPRHTYVLRFWHTIGGGVPGVTLQLLLGLTVLGALLRPRRIGLLLAWVVALYVPLTLLGGVLDPGRPRLRLQLVRYWFPVYPALVLGGLGFLWLLIRWCARRFGAAYSTAVARGAGGLAAAAIILAACVPAVTSYRTWSASATYRANGATQLEGFRSWLQGHGDTVHRIWADPRTTMVLPFFLQHPFGGRVWHGPVLNLRSGQRGPAAGDTVLLYSAHSALCGHCRQAEEAYFGRQVTLPRDYRLLWASRDGVAAVYAVR